MPEITAIVQTLGNVMSTIECSSKERQNPKPAQPPDYTPIEQAIADMLQDNTGCHILDSGGAYGRSWERNRHIQDFRQLPRFAIQIEKDGTFLTSLNVFHFLTEKLALDEHCQGLQSWFNSFAAKNPDMSWPETIETFFEKKLKPRDWSESYSENTYNRESQLSQVLQYWVYEDPNNQAYVWLQIHGGCDVRGGYTAPRIFQIIEDECSLMDDRSLFGSCDCSRADSDDGGYYFQYEMQSYDWARMRKTMIYDSGRGALPPLWKVRETEDGHEYHCKRCKKPVEWLA